MIIRQLSAKLRQLLLPLALAVAVATAIGEAGRAWHVPSFPRRAVAGRPTAPAPRPTPSAAPIEPETAQLRAERSPGTGMAAATSSTATAPAPPGAPPERSSTPRPSTSDHLFGPAPDPVAPSHEVALRASLPPPAVASAPRLAPAPVVPLTPAPEPQAPPRTSPMQTAEPRGEVRAPELVRAVRFDPGYYYGRGLSARQLAEQLTASWAEQGVNMVYYYAYNRVYGARYRTAYPGSIMEDYGRQDLLRHLIREAHRRDIKVIAWLQQGVQHKQMWEARPAWRAKQANGADYKPEADSYFLCVRNPEVTQWWLGLVDDLLTRYPDLDGIDLAEFQLDLWGDNACHCDHCRTQYAQAHPEASAPGEAWRRFRAECLTRTIQATSRLARSRGKEVHVTTVFTAARGGALMTAAQVRDATGFDLEAVLTGPDRPDIIQAELIWQQWAALYNDRNTFTPEWTTQAVRQAKSMVRGRAQLIAHIEVTDFGIGKLDGQTLARTIAAAAQGGPMGIDIYDSYQLAQTQDAARLLQTAWLNPGR